MASASPADACVALMDRSSTGHSLVNTFSTSHIMQSNMAGGWKLGRCVEPKPGLYRPHTYQYEGIVPSSVSLTVALYTKQHGFGRRFSCHPSMSNCHDRSPRHNRVCFASDRCAG